MPRVTFIGADGRVTEASGEVGQSVMSVAVNAGIEVILAECGGACACGTCHCYVDAEWIERLPPASPSLAALPLAASLAPPPSGPERDAHRRAAGRSGRAFFVPTMPPSPTRRRSILY